ncbi:6189_t:CDS:2, partial [Funneliformis geosporum]
FLMLHTAVSLLDGLVITPPMNKLAKKTLAMSMQSKNDQRDVIAASKIRLPWVSAKTYDVKA